MMRLAYPPASHQSGEPYRTPQSSFGPRLRAVSLDILPIDHWQDRVGIEQPGIYLVGNSWADIECLGYIHTTDQIYGKLRAEPAPISETLSGLGHDFTFSDSIHRLRGDIIGENSYCIIAYCRSLSSHFESTGCFRSKHSAEPHLIRCRPD